MSMTFITALRRSPFADAWATAQPSCVNLTDMLVPETFGRDACPEIALADLSYLRRSGCKGPDAAAWLKQQGIPTPDRHNRWLVHRGGVVARLGLTEYFMESGLQDDWVSGLHVGSATLTPVLRQDAALLLCGPRVHELLLQVCSYDFESLDLAAQEAVMTQMIGVSVLVILIARRPFSSYRLWCDPSFAHYLWTTLEGIAGELGGAPLGWRELRQFGIPYASISEPLSSLKA